MFDHNDFVVEDSALNRAILLSEQQQLFILAGLDELFLRSSWFEMTDEQWDELDGKLSETVTQVLTIAEGTGSTVNGDIGDVKTIAHNTIPTNWLACDGSAISRTTYSDLFALIGVSFGIGDGSTTFNLPDLSGRVVVGSGSGSGLTTRSVGDFFGDETHQLTVSELPSHTHQIAKSDGTGSNNNLAARGNTGTQSNSQTTTSTGSNEAHNNIQPSCVLTFIIKALPDA